MRVPTTLRTFYHIFLKLSVVSSDYEDDVAVDATANKNNNSDFDVNRTPKTFQMTHKKRLVKGVKL